MWVSEHRQISIQVVEGISLTVTGAAPIGDSDWDAYVERCGELFAEAGPVAVINLSPQHGPNRAQRRRMIDKISPILERVRWVVLLSESAHLRGVMIALGWMIRKKREVRAYPPCEYARAIASLARKVGVDAQPLTRALLAQANAMDVPLDGRS